MSFLFALLCCPAFSQPFPTDSATWLVGERAVSFSWPYKEHLEYFLYSLEGDSVIDGKTYSIVHVYRPKYDFYYGLLRWDSANKQVFYTKPGQEEYLLYDFSLESGDTVIVTGPIGR